MATKSGFKGQFNLGATEVLSITSWTGGGVTRQMLPASALGDLYEKWVYGKTITEPITINGLYDPADSTGQAVIEAAILAGTTLTDPRFYYSATEYLKLSTSATCLVESVGPKTADMNAAGLCPMSFSLRISNGYLEKNA